MTTTDHSTVTNPNIVVSRERLRGTAKRWRRHSIPTVAEKAEEPAARRRSMMRFARSLPSSR